MNIKNIAVFGSGIMGRGIAHICAAGGYKVKMQDVNVDILNKAVSLIENNLNKGIDRGIVTLDQKNDTLSNIMCSTELEEVSFDADMIIEAVPENMELKQRIFTKLDELCSDHTIFATNTSSMSVTEIGAVTKRQGRFIGLHFFNPVHIMKLVEIITGLETSNETIKACEIACKRMGKHTVKINEFPGFVTTRINALIGNGAFIMLQEGLGSPEDIDMALKLGLNHPMGPFEMVDLVGLDTRLKILEYLHSTLGEKYRPAPLMIKYVKAGRIGRKVGKGVYDYLTE